MAMIQPVSKKRKLVTRPSRNEDDVLYSGNSKPPPTRYPLPRTRSATRRPSSPKSVSLLSSVPPVPPSTALICQSSIQAEPSCRPNESSSVESKATIFSHREYSSEQAQPTDPLFPSSQPGLLLQSQSKQPVTSQHEDLEDLIEDTFSDDDKCSSALNTSPHKFAVNQSSQVMIRKTNKVGIAGGFGTRPRIVAKSSGSCFEVSQFSTRDRTISTSPGAVVGSKINLIAINLRPWPERFAPKSSADLAVHPKKVSEVRSWLEHVLDGFSKQRLLILTGPAGAGKTATIRTLSEELGFEILEWKNPSGAVRGNAYDLERAFNTGLTGIFEEFVGRAGRFGSLEMISTSSSSMAPNFTQRYHSSESEESKRKIILLEDFPNALFTSSQAPLTSFQHTIKSYLSFTSRHSAPSLPPLVLIISESAITSNPGAFTAHRLLAPEILHHPLATTISFNKIAPTFMLKALLAIIARESRESNREFGPSKPLIEVLTSSGDVRSAIMGLEFLAVNGDIGAFSEPAMLAKKRKRKLGDGELNDVERQMLAGVTQRESQLGIFHAIGKVVHNKRYGDDVEDPYVPPPPKPLLKAHAWKKRASKVDINILMDEAGTDAQTLISGVHENYLASCNFLGGFSTRTHSLEDLLDCVNNCLTDLSDSDMLASPRPYHTVLGAGKWGSYGGFEGASGTAGIRQDEIAFQVAVRGVILALPSPVKRNIKDNKMFYPTSLRLWRDKEETESMVDLFVRKFGLSNTEHNSGGGVSGAGRSEMVLERLPYLMAVLKGNHQKVLGGDSNDVNFLGKRLMEGLEGVTVFKGIRGQNEDILDDDLAEVGGTLEAVEEQKRGLARMKVKVKTKEKNKREKQMATKDRQWGLEMEHLALADDDIEHDW